MEEKEYLDYLRRGLETMRIRKKKEIDRIRRGLEAANEAFDEYRRKVIENQGESEKNNI